VAQYKYDAWGNHRVLNANGEDITNASELLHNHIAHQNPLRYRGYYWDTNLNLYYLKTRYYDPETCRFINMDCISILPTAQNHINGLNLYAYCLNDPVNHIDDDGMFLRRIFGGIGRFFTSAANAFANVFVGLGQGIASLVTDPLGTFTNIGLGIADFAVGMTRDPLGTWWNASRDIIMFGAMLYAPILTMGGVALHAHLRGDDPFTAAGSLYGQTLGTGAVILGTAGAGKVVGKGVYQLRLMNAARYWNAGTFKTPMRSMLAHHAKHGSSRSVFQYTKDARVFATRNGHNFSFLRGGIGRQPVWALGRGFGHGMNGLFTTQGKIISFWYWR